MVVVSHHDGRMWKLKHGGEDCGGVPDKMGDAVQMLNDDKNSSEAHIDVYSSIYNIVKNKPAKREQKKAAPKKPAPEKGADEEAIKAFESALTKEDSLDDQFKAGKKADVTKRIVKQVAEDLIKDYGVDPKEANKRANAYVNKTIGKLFGDWKKAGN